MRRSSPGVWACPACGARFRVPQESTPGARVCCPRCRRVGGLEKGGGVGRRGLAVSRADLGLRQRRVASPGAALVLGLGLVAGAVPVVVRTAGAPAQVEEVEPSAPFGERGDAVSVQGPPAPAGAADAAVEEARRLLQAGDAEGSLAVLQRVVSVRESPEAHKVLARALRRLGRFEEADGQTGDYRRGRLPDGP